MDQDRNGIWGSLGQGAREAARVGLALTPAQRQTLFHTRYALETALNFSLWLAALDLLGLVVLKGRQTFFPFLGLALLSFLAGLIVQYTIVFERIEIYFPRLILFYERYPGVRPSFFRVGWFMFQGWALVMAVLSGLLIWRAKRVGEPTDSGDRMEQDRAGPPDQERDPAGLDDRLRIDLRSISHARVEDHYCRIFHSSKGEVRQIYLKMSLKELADRLPMEDFVRVHRSHLVNLNRVTGLKNQGGSTFLVLVDGEEELPVSRRRLPQVRRLLKERTGPGTV